MLITHSREKLIDAIIFFVRNTKHCNKLKLFKLLYLLDFMHYREIGRSVTDQTYLAWENGPVPIGLEDEVKCPKADLSESIEIRKLKKATRTKFFFKPTREFNPGNFSRRELRIMNDLAKEFNDHKAKDMIDETHLENRPWHRTYKDGAGRNHVIPYEASLRNDNKDVMLEIIREHDEFKEAFNRA